MSWQRLQRNLATEQNIHQMLRMEYQKALIGEAKESMNLEVLDPPDVPLLPVWPRKSVYAFIGLVLGAMAGAFWGLRTDRRILIAGGNHG